MKWSFCKVHEPFPHIGGSSSKYQFHLLQGWPKYWPPGRGRFLVARGRLSECKGMWPTQAGHQSFFSKLKKLKELKIESNADQKTKQYFLLIYHFIKITRKYHFILYGWQIWTFWLIFMIISTLKTRDQICQPYRVTQLMKRLVFRFQKLVHFRYQS